MKNVAKEAAPIRVATYSRFSSSKQKEASITDQQRATHEDAERRGWRVVSNFADSAISGSDSNRPQYKRMLEAAKAREFDVLLVHDLARLTRDLGEQSQLFKRFKAWGVRLVCVVDGFDSDQQSSRLYGAIKGAMNEQYLVDLAANVHRGLKGQALQGRWCGGRPFGYRVSKILDRTQRDQYNEPKRIGTQLEIDPKQAKVVRFIFERRAAGESPLSIAADLNRRQVPSPGSSWRRKERRCQGWMGSSVRSILGNKLYAGWQRWNACQFVRDPDSGKDRRRERPESEWVVTRQPHLAIISEELFNKVQKQRNCGSNPHTKLKFGRRAKHLLSGLLKCKLCGANYVMGDARAYGCSSFLGGRACSNSERVRRDEMERVILGPVQDGLLNPDRVKRMARAMEAEFQRRLAKADAKHAAAPKELTDLDARIARLRTRLKEGDPDLTPDELQSAIETAEGKRQQMAADLPSGRQSARIRVLLPLAADLYRKQIQEGIGGNPTAVMRARAILRDLVGTVTLAPGKDGEVWASYRFDEAALVKSAGCGGRGDRI